ncbi:MAG: hypothetical protein GTN53_28420 [Candidatus Aminicenantes bacterium]|nr:hypothetical protein [Candidatus Aminicenantes bacterium]NIQ70396.1 hypothetical protein [Candidatus Aminicenantes bacterium]NIT26440.1 hypothetical protein [Candidatus Aminicenantes bacterium]
MKDKNKTKHRNKKKNGMNKGTSIIEALISVAIIGFVVISILAAISQQQATTKQTTDKNMAVLLAELRMEELFKFPSRQLAIEEYIDYIIFKGHGFEVYDESLGDPRVEKQFRRTTKITKDLLQQVATIRVEVEYGAVFMDSAGSQLRYPSKIVLTSRRTIK